MNQNYYDYKTLLKTGDPLVYENILVVPIMAPAYEEPEYISQDIAIKKGCLKIVEVSEMGSVPYLKAINDCKKKVLLPEGEEIEGAKQNRTFNTSILLPEKSETIIPVSCTEQGRWQYKSEKFEETDSWIPAEIRAYKNQSVSEQVFQGKNFRSDQKQIWDIIEKYSKSSGFHSKTNALRDITKKTNKKIDEILKKFPYQEQQVGVAVFVDGKLKGIDIITHPDVFKSLYTKVLKSYISSYDIIKSNIKKENILDLKITYNFDTKQATEKILNFIDLAVMGNIFSAKSPGLGNDIRIQATNVNGFALEYDDKIIHLNLLRIPI
jgi:hypothetical protein